MSPQKIVVLQIIASHDPHKNSEYSKEITLPCRDKIDTAADEISISIKSPLRITPWRSVHLNNTEFVVNFYVYLAWVPNSV